MKIFKYRFWVIVVAGYLSFMTTGLAQPNWSVSPPDFQYTMTVTGSGVFSCQETLDENDMVAAFIDGECRGVQHFSTAVNQRNLAYLIIYANEPEGAKVTIKMYDASEDEITDAVYDFDFIENASIGEPDDPYLFQTDYPLTDLLLTEVQIFDNSKKGDRVGQAIAVDEAGNMNMYSIELIDDTLGIDNAFFTVSGADLILDQDVDFATQSSFQVHVQATSESGCTINEVFVIEAENTNIPPTGLDKSDLEINENEPIGSVVLTLIAIDESPNDNHQFELIGDAIDWPDNASFAIQGNQLLSNEVFDYETKIDYPIQVLITDQVGNTGIDTLNIRVLDVIEFEDLKTSNLLTPNNDGFNDYFEIPNVHLFADYTLQFFNAAGNLLYEVKQDYDNSWQGVNHKEKELPTGTYYFLLRDNKNEMNQFVGDIHIYRARKF